MGLLDVRTIMVSHLVTVSVCTAVLALLWRRSRERFAGTGWWLADFAFQAVAAVLVILRGHIPDWLSMVVSNSLAVSGAFLGYLGLTLFVGRRRSQVHNYAILAVFVVVHHHYAVVDPDLNARNLNMSLGLLIMCAQAAWLVIRRPDDSLCRMARGVALVHGGFVLVSLCRVGLLFVRPGASNDFFRAGTSDAVLLMSYQMLLVLLTFALVLMVNQRLLGEVQFQEAKFATAFRSAHYAITLTRPGDGRILEVNDGFVATTGYSREEAVAATSRDLQLWAREEDRAAVVADLAQGLRVVEREFPFRRRSGELMIGVLSADAIQVHGEPLILSSIADITRRKQAEAALHESESKYRTLVETTDTGFLILDGQGRVVDANSEYVRLTGHRELCDIVGRQVTEWTAEPCRAANAEAVARCVRDGLVRNLVVDYVDGGGRLTSVEINATVVGEGGSLRILSLARDISERKRAETERARLEGELQQAQKIESIGRLAGGVAHDFNNMLGVILGHVENALGQLDPAQPLHADLEAVRVAAKRSADLTRQLLAFARRQAVEPRVLDLNEAVAGMLDLLRRLIGANIVLEWRPAAGLWPVKIDPSQLDQILTNLCVNARDAVPAGGRITVETGNQLLDAAAGAAHPDLAPGDYVRLAVIDNGCGMEAETLAQVFEPFFTTKAMGRGTGLGLATVYGAIRQNGGCISVASQPGQGTTFTILLPRQAEGAAPPVGGESRAVPPPRGLETVLLVEDEAAILKMAKTMLERQGYTVLAAGSPEVALGLARAHPGPIHLLVSDVVMPGMQARALIEALLPSHPQIRRLFISGYPAEVMAEHGVIGPGVCFLPKTFSIKDLAAKVREALDRAAG